MHTQVSLLRYWGENNFLQGDLLNAWIWLEEIHNPVESSPLDTTKIRLRYSPISYRFIIHKISTIQYLQTHQLPQYKRVDGRSISLTLRESSWALTSPARKRTLFLYQEQSISSDRPRVQALSKNHTRQYCAEHIEVAVHSFCPLGSILWSCSELCSENKAKQCYDYN